MLPGTLARVRHLRPELRFVLTPPGDAEPPADLALLLDHPGSGLRPTPPSAGRAGATEPVFVALPAAHPLRHHAEPAPTDLAGECRLLPTADGGCWLALFRAAHESTPFTPAAVRELPYGRREVLDPVAPGLGAAPVPGSTAPVPGVAVRPLLGTPLWLRHVLLRRRAAIDPDLADTLSGAATAAYRELAGEAPHLHDWATRTFRPPRT
ncbi:LysR substrate-binding domain-containing protein [Kitasatospora sp. NPDC090308]|uniref:LysR substrate-binding domain-containing protein n=1 Tax=Kitasatospora sp. NPDC090308 TaxID=3364082 RepID=UPI0037FC729C